MGASHLKRIVALAAFLAAALALLPPPACATAPSLGGQPPIELAEAGRAGAFRLPPRRSGLATSSAQPVWRVPIVMIEYSDTQFQHGPAEFEDLLFDSTMTRTATGSAYDYYRWVSGGRLSLRGRVVARVRLRGTRADYGNGAHGLSTLSTPNNAYGAVREALDSCRTFIDWSEFDLDRDGFVDMLWVVHTGLGGEASPDPHDLWSITSHMSVGWSQGIPYTTRATIPGSLTQFVRIDRFTILPELSPFTRTGISEIGVYCHEFGHALGLPDLYDTYTFDFTRNTGPGNWSLMSNGLYGGNGRTPQYPSHLGAWPMAFLGWAPILRPANDTTLVLRPIERGGPVLDWTFQGEPATEHFFVENRQRLDYDRNLPASGLMIYHVDDELMGLRLPSNSVLNGVPPALVMVEADGHFDVMTGRNRGDAGDPFPGSAGATAIDDDTTPDCRPFSLQPSLMALRDITAVGDDMQFRVQTRATGWRAPVDVTPPGYVPVIGYTPARVTATDAGGTHYLVTCEVRGGHPQVVLRTDAGGWSDGFEISHSPTAALDPTITAVPGGDLAVVWSDTRGGRAELYYRSRVRGVWGEEQALLRRPGPCRNATIASDARGTIFLAYQHTVADTPRVEFMRFHALLPGGQPQLVSPAHSLAGSPALVVTPAGTGYILWGDRVTSGQQIWFSRFRPDSLPSHPLPLGPRDLGTSQSAFSSVLDANGTLSTVWQVTGPSHRQLHFQRRPATGRILIPDALIESRGDVLQNPALALDERGDLHLVFERTRSGVTQIRYRRWQERWGWDAGTTEVTFPADGAATRPLIVPMGRGAVNVMYLISPDRNPRLLVRGRDPNGPALDPGSPAAAAPHAVPVTVGPNPLHAGAALDISWSGGRPDSPWLDLYDVGGRRVASACLRDLGNRWQARLDGAATGRLGPGVYFTRLRSRDAAPARLVVIR